MQCQLFVYSSEQLDTGIAEIDKIEEEYQILMVQIADFQNILANPDRVKTIIKDELSEIKRRFGDERRSEIIESDFDFEDEDLIPKEDIVITMTLGGYIKRTTVDTYRTQNRGGKGVKGMTRPGREGMNKGIKRSPETIERMRASQLGNPQIRGVPLQTPAGVFRNIGAAAEHYGVTKEAIHYFKKKYPEEYYYIK